MENIRYEVWWQNQDKFVTQCTIVLIQKISEPPLPGVAEEMSILI
jgi:hypothetical protein